MLKRNDTADGNRLPGHEQAQLYLELYKQQMAYFHETRRIEFRANVALWGAILAIGYVSAGKVHPSCIVSLGFIIGTCFLSGVWAWFLQRTKNFDKKLFTEYRARIERLLGAEPLSTEERSVAGAWWLFYVVATFLFSFGVVAFLQLIPLTTGK